MSQQAHHDNPFIVVRPFVAMPRGRFPTRITVQPPDAATLQRFFLSWYPADVHAHPERFPQLTSQYLFGNQAPLSFEIGSATGEFLCSLAARTPQHNYLGIDLIRRPLYRAVHQAAALGLTNITFLQLDVKLTYQLLAPHSLDTVFLHFPVPFNISRQQKHHVLTSDFLDQLDRLLVPVGRLSLLTDQESVLRYLRYLVGNDERFVELPPDQYRLPLHKNAKSGYHRLWEQRGRCIYQAEIARRQV